MNWKINSFFLLINISSIYAIQNYNTQKKLNKISGKMFNNENSIV